MNGRRCVLLTGATAQVGLHLLPALCAAGFAILALSRRAPPAEFPAKVETQGVHWFRPGQLRLWLGDGEQFAGGHLQHPQILVSAGPIALALGWLECCPAIEQVVCLSTSSIFSKADSGSTAERRQIAGIIQAEQQLAALCSARGIDLCLLRPTLIYGCGLDENISRMAAFIKRFGFLPLAGKAAGLRQPVHVADLADLMVRVCQSGLAGQHTFTVAGGNTLSYHDMAAKVFRALGKPPRLISLPPAVLAIAVTAFSKLARARGLDAAMVERQNTDLVFDDREARLRFDFQPRNFEPGPRDFELAAEIRGFLPPGLRP